MLRSWMAATAGSLLLTGCAPGLANTGAGSPPDPMEVRWIDGPTPDLRTLLLQPLGTTSIVSEDTGGLVEVRLGAFFTEWENEAGRLEQLALLVQVEASDPDQLMALNRELLLEVDGSLYVGEAGTTGNSVHLRAVPGGRELSVVIPVSAEFLWQLAHARTVRGVFSERAAFLLPEGSRRGFTSLLRHLPSDGRSRGPGPRLRISESTP